MSFRHLFILFLFVVVSCNRDCQEEKQTKYNIDELLMIYVNKYTPNNYWIYHNQDSTKSDSFFVENIKFPFKRIFGPNLIGECDVFESISFNLKSNLFFTGDNICRISILKDGENFTSVLLFSTSSNFSRLYKSSNQEQIHFKNGNNFFDATMFDSTINKKAYTNLIIDRSISDSNIKNKIFAPNLGLISFIYEKDTFSLSKVNF